VDDGTRCGPHGGEMSKTKSWTIEPVHGGSRVKRLGRRPGRARGVWWFVHKTIGGRFLGLGLKPCPKAQHDGDAAGSHGLRQEDAGCGEGVAVRWQDPQTLHKCPCVGCIASS
jgi:hypothetical protein